MSEPGGKTVGSPGPDHRWLVLVTVAIAQLMVVLDATIVNIALPSAQRDLGFANSDRAHVKVKSPLLDDAPPTGQGKG
jgi:hypothetical protein